MHLPDVDEGTEQAKVRDAQIWAPFLMCVILDTTRGATTSRFLNKARGIRGHLFGSTGRKFCHRLNGLRPLMAHRRGKGSTWMPHKVQAHKVQCRSNHNCKGLRSGRVGTWLQCQAGIFYLPPFVEFGSTSERSWKIHVGWRGVQGLRCRNSLNSGSEEVNGQRETPLDPTFVPAYTSFCARPVLPRPAVRYRRPRQRLYSLL